MVFDKTTDQASEKQCILCITMSYRYILGASHSPIMHHNVDVTNSFHYYLAKARFSFRQQNDTSTSIEEKILVHGNVYKVF